mmetsp:Transcript_83596/g.167421  ORF Transcript_83596/g.167421 Transcript_83596/m.167421 type:complete len:215 (-) Transcript_83596:1436-2080(-)
MSGSPNSAIQDAPASKWLNRFMSSSGTWHTAAPKRLDATGRVSMLPTMSPPLEPPITASFGGEVMLRAMRSAATASTSSYALNRFSLSAAWCHLGPYSPPPRMFATTFTPPRSSHPTPTPPLYPGVNEISNPPYASTKVGFKLSNTRSRRRITKYGILVPSFETAKFCSTTSPSLSNIAGMAFRLDTSMLNAASESAFASGAARVASSKVRGTK